jgi:hypothetical protein
MREVYSLNRMNNERSCIVHHECPSFTRDVTESATLLPSLLDDRTALMRVALANSQSRCAEQHVEDQDAG